MKSKYQDDMDIKRPWWYQNIRMISVLREHYDIKMSGWYQYWETMVISKYQDDISIKRPWWYQNIRMISVSREHYDIKMSGSVLRDHDYIKISGWYQYQDTMMISKYHDNINIKIPWWYQIIMITIKPLTAWLNWLSFGPSCRRSGVRNPGGTNTQGLK